MTKGDILGHEFMGEVVEVGKDVSNLAIGDRVVVPFPIACGDCNTCAKGLFSLCENSNPNAGLAEKMWGHAPAGIFGYSSLTGGYAGGQAEYARVPFADVGPIKIENDDLSDDQVLFLSDIFPTGYMGAELCDIEPGDVIAVWGAGPVGLFAIASAIMLGAERVIAIDRFDYRLDKAREAGATDVIDYEQVEVPVVLKELTGGRGPDACIDCVGQEAHHPHGLVYGYDRVKQAARLETERALRAARGDPELRQRRHRVDHGRLRRVHGQVPDRLGHEQVADDQDGPSPRSSLPAPAPGADRERGDRPQLRRVASPPARRRAQGLRDVQAQAGQLHQGRAQAVTRRSGPALAAALSEHGGAIRETHKARVR